MLSVELRKAFTLHVDPLIISYLVEVNYVDDPVTSLGVLAVEWLISVKACDELTIPFLKYDWHYGTSWIVAVAAPLLSIEVLNSSHEEILPRLVNHLVKHFEERIVFHA